MSEDSGEQAPHKFSRVPDIKTSRQNLTRRRDQRQDQRQISLMQRALRGDIMQVSENEHSEDEIRIALFSVVDKIGQMAKPGENPFTNMGTARLINESVGPLLTNKTRMRVLGFPSKEMLLVLKTDPSYDPKMVQRLIDVPELRMAYNRMIGPLKYSHGNYDYTVGDLQTKEKEVAALRGMTLRKVLISQAAFKPVH